MCDCSNYCQLLVGPRLARRIAGQLADARRWALVVSRRPRGLRPPDRRETPTSPDLCNWRVRAGPRGVDEELRLPEVR